MPEKIRLREVLVVEGKYDATAMAGLVDGLIITTDGFSVFSDKEKKELLQKLGKERGLLVLTDSDAAGFAIRHYIDKIAVGCGVKHAYIPAVEGKEKRKAVASKEGTLGVEGLPRHVLLQALQRAGIEQEAPRQGEPITYTDLYEWGLSGGEGSAEKRRAFLHKLGLPARLSKKALVEVLSSLYTREEVMATLQDKPVLFWDFHGTLTLPDVMWFDVAMEAAAEQVPERPLQREVLEKYFSYTCLPWFTVESGDTRDLVGENWWRYCEQQFIKMLGQCGFSIEQAQKIAPQFRSKSMEPERYSLYLDAIVTLQELQKRGYESYILSNNFPELEHVVEELGLRPLFAGVISSGNIGYDKPHQGIFAEAQKHTNGRKAWMIGDNPRDDIEGGNKAGFTTVAVHGVKAHRAEYQINDLREILALLP